MNKNSPRIMIAGTNSGCGKTTVTCGLLQALVNRNLEIASFKCGPDYIDPMFHSKVIGTKSRNLDSYFCSENTLKYLMGRTSEGMDMSIIEGVMGYYDGLGSTNLKASSYDVARITDTPVILVVNCKGMSLSIVPIIKGFKDYVINSNIKGVILNNMSKMIYNEIKEVIENELEVKVYGYIPDLKELTIESRHLGLITPNDILDIKEKLNKLAEVFEETLNIDGIIELANTVSSLKYNDVQVKKVDKKVKIAVAYDEAFCFYYEDNIQMLRDMGAEVVYFSPIRDSELPKDCSGLIIGGGYPELYAKELSENISMKNSIKVAIENGLPTIAECGGFMYLNQSLEDINGNIFEMIGLIKGNSYRTNKLGRFGYIELIAKEDNYLLKKGEKTLAHEFHYWDSTCCGNKFIATKTLRNRNWDCINIYKNLIAGYPHIHFYSNLNIPFNFLSRCNDFSGGNI